MIDAFFGRLTDAPARLLITGARVVDPASRTDGVRDLAIADGMIAETPLAEAERIDGRGLVVAPGFCDLHAHLRQPGESGAETTETGARAAAHGGFTTICAMPNTDPPLDSADAVRAASSIGGACRVRVIGAATRGRAGATIGDVDGMAGAGAVGFSDDGSAIGDADVAAAVFRALSRLGLPLLEHAEDSGLAGAGVMRSGATSTRLGLAGWSTDAEVAVVERDLALAEETGARLHLTHLSTARALAAVRAARSRGVHVTCDVTPHHLAMTDAWVAGSRAFAWEAQGPDERAAYDGTCRVNPPLASMEDALALLAGLEDGSVDAIATDHAPHPQERTQVPFEHAAPGLIGLETALSIGLAAVRAGRLSLGRLLAGLSSRPAAIIGETRGLTLGAAADLVAFDPEATWRVDRRTLASASVNTPLLGRELPGVVRLTLADGRVTYRS
jgi:dihydroorotase